MSRADSRWTHGHIFIRRESLTVRITRAVVCLLGAILIGALAAGK